MPIRIRAAAAAGLVLLPCLASGAGAQVRASEQAGVSQTIAGTHIVIEYSRPVARGRDDLFGGVVRWDETWTPGANWATTFEADDSIRLNGNSLPAGKYSVWMIPREDSAWTVILNRDARRFHTQKPEAQEDAIRFEVRPAEGPHMETLAWYFPVIGPGGAVLRMHWGTTWVPLEVSVPSPPVATLRASERTAYLGTYRFIPAGPPPGADPPPEGAEGARRNGDGPPRDGPPPQLVVSETGETLRARMEPPTGEDIYEMALVPNGTHRFNTGFYMDGELVEIETEMTVVFTMGPDGKATSFEVLGLEGRVMGRGERVR